MEEITSAVRAVCITAAGICIIGHITEGTRLRSQAEFVYKLVFVAVVAGLIFNVKGKINFPDLSGFDRDEISFSTESYDNAVAEQTGKNISDILLSQLSAAGIKVDNIRTEVNISHDGSISINRVIISTAELEKAAGIIRSSLGQETEVVNGDS
ncbi:hypothetical protein [Ruminococcus flavefaciens]|uniref:Stage III sporulation protein AF n=1 Tax=Ruminococcus flavefaciens TaxID=1265 RepID=A0A1M7HWD6_RUMFL|nr:hypothetical protein [Ruminococcus flavefaciens]SHM32794.1 hypothetical protein SAMN04487860_103139 [Ruminococcus flavefaciens]